MTLAAECSAASQPPFSSNPPCPITRFFGYAIQPAFEKNLRTPMEFGGTMPFKAQTKPRTWNLHVPSNPRQMVDLRLSTWRNGDQKSITLSGAQCQEWGLGIQFPARF
jgi:hypothetical protein